MVVSYYLQCNHYSEKREKKSLFREKICRLPFHFVNKTRTKAYDISTMSIFCFAFKSTYGRKAGGNFTSYSYDF